jgi:hypothetical protein
MSSPNLIETWMQMMTAALGSPITIRFPGGGDIGGFTYQPHTVWEAPTLYRGNAALEQTIYSTVASPGKQLGKLTDLVLQMAELLEPQLTDKRMLREVRTMAADIRGLTSAAADAGATAAREELEKLRRSSETQLRALIAEYHAELQCDAANQQRT